jgi:hypothetical protein
MPTTPSPRRLAATGYGRPMKQGESGGSEPHVFETADGHYMVKTRNNPQGLRVLANELVGGLCLDWLEVHHPEPAVITIDQALIDLSPEAKFRNGRKLEHGEAFGSKYWQSDPSGTVSANLIENKADVAGTLAFDTWLPPSDARQHRLRASKEAPGRYDYFPVDQGHQFGNPNWTASELANKQNAVATPAPIVPMTADDLAPFIERLRAFSDQTATHIIGEIPEDWLDNNLRQALKKYLVARAGPVADALAQRFKSKT